MRGHRATGGSCSRDIPPGRLQSISGAAGLHASVAFRWGLSYERRPIAAYFDISAAVARIGGMKARNPLNFVRSFEAVP